MGPTATAGTRVFLLRPLCGIGRKVTVIELRTVPHARGLLARSFVVTGTQSGGTPR